MRRTIIALALSTALAGVLLWQLVLPAAAGMMGSKTGDVNVDGHANSLDAVVVLQYGASLYAPPAMSLKGWVAAADVNCDQGVDSVDASLILQADAGLYTLRP